MAGKRFYNSPVSSFLARNFGIGDISISFELLGFLSNYYPSKPVKNDIFCLNLEILGSIEAITLKISSKSLYNWSDCLYIWCTLNVFKNYCF